MYLTETHIIKNSEELDILTFKCKNLYNRANYVLRQEFINNGKYINKFDMFTQLINDPDYKALPSRVARNVIRTLDGNWRGFFALIKDWSTNKSAYKGKPNLPKYLDKKGKFNAIFMDSGINKPFECKNPKRSKYPNKSRKGIGFSSLDLRINTKIPYKQIKEVNIKPLPTGKYKINIIYEVKEEKLKENNGNYCSIDLGLNNLMTLTSNKPGLKPVLVNGRPLKSINQYYNKKLAKLQSELPKGIYKSKRINKLTEKRNNKINDYLHKSSKFLIKWCLENGLNTIILGYNEGWKTEINIGKKNNQNFVGIPLHKLKWFVEYRCKKRGFNFRIHEESYTSKCSFLDLESVKKQETYLGSRISRGLFRSGTGRLINSDVNGSLNILRKAVPNIFIDGIEGVAVHPERIKSFR
jgi:putative transposase